MNPENTGKSLPPSFFARRKGCLIALLILPLFLGLLYAYLAFVPTGYEEKAKATRAAAREVLASRFEPQEKDSTRPSPDPVPPTQPPRVSPEEARFWENAWTELMNWKTAWESGDKKAMRVDFGNLDIAAIEKRVQAELRNPASQWGKYRENLNRERTLGYFDQLVRFPIPERGTVERQTLVGIAILQSVDETEQRILLKNSDAQTSAGSISRLMEYGGIPLSHRSVLEKLINEKNDKRSLLRLAGGSVNSDTYLVLYRKLRNGNSEEITQWIDLHFQHYGESIVQNPYSSDYQDRMEALKGLLSWMALQPKIPEAILESVSKKLASWQLTPEEYRVLRTADLYEEREWQILSLQRENPRENGWHYFFWGKPEKIVSRLAEPLLIRAIDRETEALIQLDAPGYGRARKTRGLIVQTMNFPNDSENSENTEELGKRFMSQRSYDRKQPETFNRRIAMTRFAFASARYRREHGRYPDSATDLIPRYLDESFAPTPDRLWFIFKPEPFTALVLPNSYDLPSSATQVLINYAKSPENEGKIPTSVDDLKPYAAPGTDLTPLDRCFVRIDECPVYGLVVRNDPILNEETRSETESGTEGGGGGTDAVGKDSQYLYFPAPLWDPDRFLASPPRESDGPVRPRNRKPGDEKP